MANELDMVDGGHDGPAVRGRRWNVLKKMALLVGAALFFLNPYGGSGDNPEALIHLAFLATGGFAAISLVCIVAKHAARPRSMLKAVGMLSAKIAGLLVATLFIWVIIYAVSL